MVRLSAFSSALGLLAAATAARAECSLGKYVMPVTMVGSRPTVEVKLDDHPARRWRSTTSGGPRTQVTAASPTP